MTIKEPNTVATASTPCPSNMHPQEPNNIWVQNIATFITSPGALDSCCVVVLYLGFNVFCNAVLTERVCAEIFVLEFVDCCYWFYAYLASEAACILFFLFSGDFLGFLLFGYFPWFFLSGAGDLLGFFSGNFLPFLLPGAGYLLGSFPADFLGFLLPGAGDLLGFSSGDFLGFLLPGAGDLPGFSSGDFLGFQLVFALNFP
ncbi:hypothetical protein OWV82_006979 [Melia azedarach]|uniref:Uncharacterized protein n=1 Tax=Melia azedarach TaxID=155640 RepID=A0ACC1YJC8_MELAZ|nr:hypothetical protein OWV82_006979 [Melia azedarach]